MTEETIRVLSIEDNPADAHLIREKLAESELVGWDLPHFEIETVERLQMGLTRLSEGHFDAVLSDLDLPDSRAADTVSTLRQHFPKLPLVVLTGREDESLARRSVRAGIQDYLYKNEATGSLLARTLMYAIERQHVHEALESRVEARTQALARANAALREREARLSIIFEESPAGVTETALDGHWLRVNPRFCEIVGYSEVELSTMTYKDITHPEDLEVDAALTKRALDGEITQFTVEKRYIRKSGAVIWVNLMATLVRTPEGAPFYFVAVIEDISERKRAEAVAEARLRIVAASKTQSSEQLMQMTLDEIESLTDSEIGFYHFLSADQQDLTLCAWSTNTLSEACSAEGIERHDLISNAGIWVDCVRKRRPVIHNDYASVAYRKGLFPPGHPKVIRELVIPIMRRDEVVAILGVGNKSTDYGTADSEIASLLGDFSWEIVSRKEAEDRLRFQAQLLAAVGQAVIATDPEGKIIYWNHAAEALYGWPEHEVLGRDIVEVTPTEATREEAKQIIEHLLAGETWSGEFVVQHRDGTTFPAIVTDTPILDEHGRLIAVIGITTDITARRDAEVQLENYAQRLERSNRELEQFAYVISHDLQEPARVVSSYLRLLAQHSQDELDEGSATYVAYAIESAERMQSMIRALLALSRLDTGGDDLAPTDTEDLLKRTLRVLAYPITESNAEISHDTLPTVMADCVQLGQVLQNLIANAIKFQQGPTIPKVHISAEKTDDAWMFSIADNGIGIAAAHLDRIFEIFQRLHTQEQYPGTGIGLALCERIIERHGGRLWVESEIGQGSTFYFTIPIRDHSG